MRAPAVVPTSGRGCWVAAFGAGSEASVSARPAAAAFVRRMSWGRDSDAGGVVGRTGRLIKRSEQSAAGSAAGSQRVVGRACRSRDVHDGPCEKTPFPGAHRSRDPTQEIPVKFFGFSLQGAFLDVLGIGNGVVKTGASPIWRVPVFENNEPSPGETEETADLVGRYGDGA